MSSPPHDQTQLSFTLLCIWFICDRDESLFSEQPINIVIGGVGVDSKNFCRSNWSPRQLIQWTPQSTSNRWQLRPHSQTGPHIRRNSYEQLRPHSQTTQYLRPNDQKHENQPSRFVTSKKNRCATPCPTWDRWNNRNAGWWRREERAACAASWPAVTAIYPLLQPCPKPTKNPTQVEKAKASLLVPEAVYCGRKWKNWRAQWIV